jgi:lysophospholipase L1-like esterase
VLDGQGLIDIDGFLPLSTRFNPATYYQKYSRVAGNSDADYANFSLEGQQFEALKSLAEFTRSQKIPLVFVNLPLTEIHLDPFRREREQQFQQKMLQVSGELGFTYRDLLENWKTENDLFSDPSHLNRYGAYVVSQHLAKDPLIPWIKR